jgi:Ca-activated chloride channel family protein
MNAPDKLPLLKNSFKLLLDTLEPDDMVAIVVYAGAAGTVLEPTEVREKSKILNALENLSAGGSTAGSEGIRQAYRLAEENFKKDGVNRILLATDGDFNVGISNREELKDFVERKRETGIFLSVLGFGQGNLNDHMMQTLAQNGNGVAAYIDTLSEARKVLVEEASSTLFSIAKDVKIQVEFNSESVDEYRLIGYETRALNREDFNNDAVDAGDIGAGHTVTAIYEITPKGGPRTIDDSRYTKAQKSKPTSNFSDEYAFLKIRYKNPDEDTSKLITTPITTANEVSSIDKANNDTRFATSVAAFGQLLKGGKYTADFSYEDVIDLAQGSKGEDNFGYRTEFVNLVRLAKSSAAMK